MFAKKTGSDAGFVRANRRWQESGKMVSCRGICTGLCIQQSDDALPGAEILFPGQVLCVQEGLQETDFGDFEYKNYEELKENPAYQAWIDSGGQMMVPNGESGAGFRHRCCRAYEQCVRDAQEKGAQRIAIVCHGGTIMSVLERYGRPEKSFYEWQIANGCGILTETIEEGGYHYGIREIGKWE